MEGSEVINVKLGKYFKSWLKMFKRFNALKGFQSTECMDFQ